MPALETRAFAKTGMQPKSLGLGGAWWGAGTEAEGIAGIHRALELGFNYLDTYPELETWWGKALAGGRRHNIYLQAKVTTNGPQETISDHSGPQTRRSVEASLKRLRTDYLDNVLIHGYDEPEDVGSKEGMVDPLAPGHALDELVKMKEEGSIRHIGIGARNSAVHRRALETGQIEICLTYLEYNLFNTAAATDLFPRARQCQVGLILASPLGMGLLTGDEKVFECSAAYFDNREYPERKTPSGGPRPGYVGLVSETRREHPPSGHPVLLGGAHQQHCPARCGFKDAGRRSLRGGYGGYFSRDMARFRAGSSGWGI